MKSGLGSLAVVAFVLAASLGCVHRTSTMYRTSETVRTDTGRQEVAPQPPVEESQTVIRHSHTSTEEEQK